MPIRNLYFLEYGRPNNYRLNTSLILFPGLNSILNHSLVSDINMYMQPNNLLYCFYRHCIERSEGLKGLSKHLREAS